MAACHSGLDSCESMPRLHTSVDLEYEVIYALAANLGPHVCAADVDVQLLHSSSAFISALSAEAVVPCLNRLCRGLESSLF